MKVGDRILALLLVDAKVLAVSDQHGRAYQLQLASESPGDPERTVWITADEITGGKVVKL